MDPQRGECRASKELNALPVCIKEANQFDGSVGSLLGCCFSPFQKKLQPLLPNAFRADPLQQFVVVCPMHLEIQAEIKQRLPQSAPGTEQERNQQAPEPSIAVQEGVDGFKLHMDEAQLH